MHIKSSPTVAIILINWNSYEDTYECLLSLDEVRYDAFHVYVVDNHSQDGSYEQLESFIESGQLNIDVTLLQSGANLGFSGGNNVGMKKAYDDGYNYIWLLNNDTTVEPDVLTPLVNEMEADESVGIVGSKIYFAGTNLLWFAGGQLNRYAGSTHNIGYKQKDEGQYDKKKEVKFIVGCSLMIRREILESVGYLDEDYFLYYEDTDWNIRAASKGWKILFVPESIVHHKVSSSTQSKSVAPFFAYYNVRNSYLMIRKTQKRIVIITAFLNMGWKVIKHHLRIFVKNQDSKRIRSSLIFRGALDALRLKSGRFQ